MQYKARSLNYIKIVGLNKIDKAGDFIFEALFSYLNKKNSG